MNHWFEGVILLHFNLRSVTTVTPAFFSLTKLYAAFFTLTAPPCFIKLDYNFSLCPFEMEILC